MYSNTCGRPTLFGKAGEALALRRQAESRKVRLNH
jgi:hypothetical protein